MTRLHALLIAGALLGAACNAPVNTVNGGGTHNVQLADSLRLDYRKQVAIPNSSLAVRLDSLVQDSRCPPDVVCVWAGDLVVNVRVEQLAAASPSSLADTLRFSTANGRSQVAFGYRFDLVAERPPHRSDETVPPETYWIALRVVALSD